MLPACQVAVAVHICSLALQVMSDVQCPKCSAPRSCISTDVRVAALAQIDEAGRSDGGQTGMVTLHQMAEATFGQAGASATSVVYLGAFWTISRPHPNLHRGLVH